MRQAAERKALLEETRQGIRELLLAAEPTPTRPLLSREEGGRRFLQAIEAVLRHGLAHENTEELSLWRVMKKAMQRGWARQVSDLHCVRTDDGRTRALLRAGLNGKFLDHLLDAVLPLTPKMYAEHALLRQTEEAGMLVEMLGGLAGVDFALTVDDPHLDALPAPSAFPAADGKVGSTTKKKKTKRTRRVALIDNENHQQQSVATASSDAPAVTEEDIQALLVDGPCTAEDNDNSTKIAPRSSAEDWDFRDPELDELIGTIQLAGESATSTTTSVEPAHLQSAPLDPVPASHDTDPADDLPSPSSSGATPSDPSQHPPAASSLAVPSEKEHPPAEAPTNLPVLDPAIPQAPSCLATGQGEEAMKSGLHSDIQRRQAGASALGLSPTPPDEMTAKQREIEELQRKLCEIEERLSNVGSSGHFLPSALPSFSSSAIPPFSAAWSAKSTTSGTASDAPSDATPSANESDLIVARIAFSPPPLPSSSPSPSPSPPASLSSSVVPPTEDCQPKTEERAQYGDKVGRLYEEGGFQQPPLPASPTSDESAQETEIRVVLPPDRKDLFAASLFSSFSSSSSSRSYPASSSSSPRKAPARTASTDSSPFPQPFLSPSSGTQRPRESYGQTTNDGDESALRRNPVRAGKRQILFHLPQRGTVADQKYLCADCSTKITPWLLGGAGRYCEYTGLYYCSDCHHNETSVVPAHVLHAWDFRPFRVCRSAKRVLDEVYHLPAFAVLDINPRLYALSPSLHAVRALREQLGHMLPFVLTCREKDRLLPIASRCLDLINTDEVYSLGDLVEVENGQLGEGLRRVGELWLQHIIRCELCRGKGSICEVCADARPIYPFQLRTTTKCERCRALFHRTCFDPHHCPKCARITARKLLLQRAES